VRARCGGLLRVVRVCAWSTCSRVLLGAHSCLSEGVAFCGACGKSFCPVGCFEQTEACYDVEKYPKALRAVSRHCYWLALSKPFDWFITLAICFNTVCRSLWHCDTRMLEVTHHHTTHLCRCPPPPLTRSHHTHIHARAHAPMCNGGTAASGRSVGLSVPSQSGADDRTVQLALACEFWELDYFQARCNREPNACLLIAPVI
jgi:hypothetical protein